MCICMVSNLVKAGRRKNTFELRVQQVPARGTVKKYLYCRTVSDNRLLLFG